MTRRVLAWLACSLALIAEAVAAEPPAEVVPLASLPQWQRLLPEEDVRRVKELTKQRDDAVQTDDYGAALAAAEEVLSLRERVQGADHWEAIDARWFLDALRTAAALPPDERQEWNAAVHGQKQAEKLYNAGNYPQSAALLERALTLSDRVLGPDHPHSAERANDLAVLWNAMSRYEDAHPLYERGLDVRRRVLGEEHPDTGLSFNNVAHSLNSLEDPDKAEAFYRLALEILRRVHGEEHESTAMAYSNIASCMFNRGDYAGAAPLVAQVLDTFLQTLKIDDPRVAAGYNNLAVVLNAQHKYAEAEPLLRWALQIRKEQLGDDNPDTALSRNNLSFNLNAQGRFDEAAVEAEIALDTLRRRQLEDHPYAVMAHTNLATILNAQGKYEEAEEHLLAVMETLSKILPANHPYFGTGLNNLASNLFAQGHIDESNEHCRAALELRRRVLGDVHPDTVLSWSNLASNLYAQADIDAAHEAVLAAANGYDAARLRIAARGLDRAADGAEHSPYLLLAAMEARAGQGAAAWQAMEADLARGLLDESAARAGAAPDSVEEARREQLLAAIQNIEPCAQALAAVAEPSADERRQFDSLLAECAAAERELAELGAAFSRRQMADLADVQSVLATDAAFVAWVDILDLTGQVREHWGCVVRSAGNPVCVPLPGTGADGNWTEEDFKLPLHFREALSEAAGIEEVEDLGRLLFSQRIEPLLPHLEGVERLQVAAVNLMAGVPVEALVPDRFTISYAPSGTQLVRLKRQERPTVKRGLLALGDALFARPEGGEPLPVRMDVFTAYSVAQLTRGQDWDELPGSRAEIASLEKLFPDCLTLSDSQASEQSLEALRESGELAQFRYLHLATHGQANRASAFESALILAQDDLSTVGDAAAGEAFYDGRLTAHEILEHWKLNAELVTLSSCESGLGRSGGGEGFLGFAQALLLAGSRSVCLSLWEVNDTAAALLMDRFYQNLLGRSEEQAPLPKAEALAEAKRWLRTLTVAQAQAITKERFQGLTRGPHQKTKVVDLVPPTAPDTESHPYEHPYFWAAFVLIGDAE